MLQGMFISDQHMLKSPTHWEYEQLQIPVLEAADIDIIVSSTINK